MEPYSLTQFLFFQRSTYEKVVQTSLSNPWFLVTLTNISFNVKPLVHGILKIGATSLAIKDLWVQFSSCFWYITMLLRTEDLYFIDWKLQVESNKYDIQYVLCKVLCSLCEKLYKLKELIAIIIIAWRTVSSSVNCKCLLCDMVMDELLKVKEAVVRHPIFVIGSAVWMLADMTLDIVSVLGYHALSEEVWIIL